MLVFEAFQFILKKQIEILQIEMNFPEELSNIVKDIWIMYVTATKTYYIRKEVKEKNKKNEEDEEINRILKEAGVSDSDTESDSGSDVHSNSGSDIDSSDQSTNINSSSDETVIESENDEENSNSTAKRIKESHHSHPKKRKSKKHKAKSKETMIEEIHQHITMPPLHDSLIKLSVIFIYMGCLWLRLPVTISDFHTWISNEDIPFLSAIYCIPYKIKQLLKKREIYLLTPKTIPTCAWLNSRTAYIIHYYEKTFKFSFPPINYPVIACRMLSLLSLPAEAYLCFTRLVQLTKLNFAYNNIHDYPQINLVALIVIVVKLIYGLDNEPRISDEFCKNFYPLDRWMDCLLQRRKEYDNHGLPLYENDYLNFITNNMEKFVEYCQKTFIDRHDANNYSQKNYKIFKDIVKFIKKENSKKEHHNPSKKETNTEEDAKKEMLTFNLESSVESDQRITKIISGFKTLPEMKRKNSKNSKSKKHDDDKDNDEKDERSDEDVKSLDTIAASISAIMNSSQPKKKYNKNRKVKKEGSDVTDIPSNKPCKRKYPGDHYVTYRSYDQGGEYHTYYAILLQYCQDVLLRLHNDRLQHKISALENVLKKHELWLEEYFKQDKFINEKDQNTVSSSRPPKSINSTKNEAPEDIYEDILSMTAINNNGNKNNSGDGEDDDNDGDNKDNNNGEDGDSNNGDDDAKKEDIETVEDQNQETQSLEEEEKEVIEDSETDSELDNIEKEVISLKSATTKLNNSRETVSKDEIKEVVKPTEEKEDKAIDEKNDHTNDDVKTYEEDLIEVLMQYEEKDEIEYPYY
ncbi:hypothetical protein BCR36DRAFT_588078 [Piromyces finnis]|uniref:Uncharacterized protein n=1 Tax=Piromyces finnis TaxID=1754191 RepID=A0A1Y1UVY2_9FUNG|nr:hypothetical protein BCR36DRAFT_588078 [Piromyces finnis]|eukprot:ORX41385.1 hypothetical protein BCR36DRAFT_588078 [Piromyces finnis]